MPFALEQDKPFDPLNVCRYILATIITDRHGPFYLLRQSGLGMILGILPGRDIRIVSGINVLQPSYLITLIYILCLWH